jgi:hypothetical protein
LPLLALFTAVGPVPEPRLVAVRDPMASARPPVNPGLSTPAKLLWALSTVVPPTDEVPGMVVGPMLLVLVPAPPDIELPDALPVGVVTKALPEAVPLVKPLIEEVPMPVEVDPPLLELPMTDENPENILS